MQCYVNTKSFSQIKINTHEYKPIKSNAYIMKMIHNKMLKWWKCKMDKLILC